MSKYKVETDTKLPSEETIKKSMDFEKVLKTVASDKYNMLDARKKMHKKRKYIMWGMVIFSVLLALLASFEVI